MGRLLLFLLAAMFLAWTGFTAMTQVRPGERAVIRRFGRILPEKPAPGLYIGWPWGIERVEPEDVSKARTITVGFVEGEEKEEEVVPAGQMITGDHNLVNVQAVIEFKVDEDKVDKFVLQKDTIEAFLARAAESLLAEWIAGRKVDDVLTQGKIELPGFLRDELQTRLARYVLGVKVERANISKLFPPEQVKPSFDRVAQAYNNIGTKVNEAQQRAEKEQRAADGLINNMLAQARTYAATEVNKAAPADANSFLTRLEQYQMGVKTDPAYMNVLWLNEITQLYARLRDMGRIGMLDHYLEGGGLTITEFPLQPRKK